MKNKPFYKSWSFWLHIATFLLVVLFIVFGSRWMEELENRFLYGGIFWGSMLILNLSYLLLTKEEVRQRREESIKAYFENRKIKKEKQAEASVAEKSLRKKFFAAKKTIKESSIYSATPYSNYELPWYLVMGKENSKKASVLRHSGLDFPVNINYKDSEYEDNRDDMSAFRWFFSEESIFINVPNAYVSTESSKLELTVWEEFLRLFKKERWQRPVNGIILTLRVEEFMNKKSDELKEYAKVLRARFNELSKAFFSDIPVYVVISGLETLTGFYEFFNTLTPEEKREILGVTFEEKLLNINADTITLKFSELQERLEGDRIDKLHREWSIENRTKAYFFNDEFRALMQRVTIFNSQVFSKTRYHAPLMLRGIYFTSVDEPKSEVLEGELDTSVMPSVSANSSDMPKGMFLPRVFERIILSESTLVKIDDKFKKKYGLLQGLLAGILFLTITGLTLYWSMFIANENNEVRSIEETVRNYNTIRATPLPTLTLRRAGMKEKKVNKVEQIGQLGGKTGSANVNFLSNDSNLSLFAKAELNTIANKIKLLDPTTHVKIFGYTDNVGDEAKNLQLSLDRAKAIKVYFVSRGVHPDCIVPLGKGSEFPIASNDTIEGRSLNRRVEIFAYGVEEYINEEPTYKESYKVKFRPEEWANIIKTLDTLCDIGADDENKIASQIWKPGFYKVAERNEWVTKLYHQTLNTILLERVALIIKRELLNNLEDRQKTTDALKAYLLLNNDDRRAKNPDYLRQYMLHRWGNLTKEQVKKLNKHFDTLLSVEIRKIVLDEKAIKRARDSIMTKSGAAGLYYKTLIEVTSTMNLNEFQFNQVLASNPQAIRGGEFTIEGIYTKKGYKTIIFPKSKSILKQAIEANWILGKSDGYSDSEFKYLHKQILNLYFADYRKKWSRALAKISVPKYIDPKDLTEQLALFSSPASPIVDILRAVKENTFILTHQEEIQKKREQDKTGIGAKLGKKLNAINSVEDPHQQYKLDLRASFKGYHKLIDKNNLPSRELMPFQTRMEEVYAQVLMVDTSSEQSKRALEIVKNNSSAAKGSFEIKHSFVPLTVTAWYNGMLKQNWEAITSMAEGQINKEFISEIWDDYSKKIANRFPLNPEATDDIEMEDFVVFFGKDGIMDNFYKKYLFPFIKDVNYKAKTYKKKEIDGSVVEVDKALIDSMFQAKEIQALMFDEGGVALEIAFKLEALKMSDIHSTMEVQYEDQLLLYEHGPKVEVKFIAPGASRESLAKFTLYDFNLKRVVKVRGRGEWAMLRLLYQLNPKVEGRDIDGVKVKFSYVKNGNSGSFTMKGKSSNIFSENSPLLAFSLKDKE